MKKILPLLAACCCIVASLSAQTVGALRSDSSLYPLTLELPNADGDYFFAKFGSASFGANLTTAIEAEVEWSRTATGDTLGCAANVNDLTGKIALVRRGVCGFSVKVSNAAKAGAVAVLICNDNRVGGPGATIGMSGLDSLSTATLPSMFVSELECRSLVSLIESGAAPTARMAPIALWGGTSYWHPFVPESQAMLPYPSPRAQYFNASTTDSIFEATLTMTKPDGTTSQVGSYTDTISFEQSEPIVFTDANVQLDGGVGEYTFTYSTDLPGSNDYVQVVTVTSDYFQSHAKPQAGHYQPTPEVFNDLDGRLRWGMAFTCDENNTAQSLNLGICNAAQLIAADAPGNYLEVFVIDVDADDDGVFDFAGSTTLTDWGGDNIIGGGEYTLTGTEVCSRNPEDLINVPLEDGNGPNDEVVFEEGKTYMVYAEFGVNGAGNQVEPMIQTGQIDSDVSVVFGGERVYTSMIETTNVFSGFFLLGAAGTDQQAAYQSTTPFTRLTLGGIVGTNEPVLAGQLILAPNPADNFSELSYSLGVEPTNGQVQVIDVMGKVLETYPLPAGRSGKLQVQTANYAAGLYNVRVSTDAGVRTLRLNVVR